ncbi:MAG: Na+/H+ antiporter subunit B [Fimbriimonadaceae bacterium]
MESLILQAASRFMMPLFLSFSLFLLLRGHDLPGGGFIGGLVFSAAFALHALTFGLESARQTLRVEPKSLLGTGLALAILAGILAVVQGYDFLTGLWSTFQTPMGELKLGTPLLFDLGVFLVVIGTMTTIAFELFAEGEQWNP